MAMRNGKSEKRRERESKRERVRNDGNKNKEGNTWIYEW